MARLAHNPFDSSDHLFELKWDGIRALALVHNGALKLLDRNSRDITQQFPELSKLPRQIKGNGVILDGELVCLDDRGRPNYLSIERRLGLPTGRGSRSNPVHFIAFDLLYTGFQPVMGLPLIRRKDLLNDLLAPNEIAQQSDYIENDGKSFFHATCELGLEGILAKEKSSLYLPGRRSRDWLKVKRVRESEFVIGGYTFGGGASAGGVRKDQPFVLTPAGPLRRRWRAFVTSDKCSMASPNQVSQRAFIDAPSLPHRGLPLPLHASNPQVHLLVPPRTGLPGGVRGVHRRRNSGLPHIQGPAGR